MRTYLSMLDQHQQSSQKEQTLAQNEIKEMKQIYGPFNMTLVFITRMAKDKSKNKKQKNS